MWFVLCMWQCPTNFTDYNGAQTHAIILWRTGWHNTLNSSDGVVRWGTSACSTRDTLCTAEEGWSPPPSTVAHVPSQQTWVGSTRKDQEYLLSGCGKGAGGQVGHLVVQEEGGVMKTRGLTRHSKQPTNFCSPCCGQPSIRSSSPTSTAERSGWQSLTIKPTAHFKFRPSGTFNLSHTISKYVCGCGMRTFKESTKNFKVNYIMMSLARCYSHLYRHKPFASLVDLTETCRHRNSWDHS